MCLRLCGKDCETLLISAGAVIPAAALGVSLISAWRLLPSRDRVMIYLCSLVPGGGVILSAAECGRIPENMPELPSLPPIRFKHLPLRLGTLTAGLIFAAGTLFCPLQMQAVPVKHSGLDLKDESKKFAAALETLRNSSPEGEKKALPLQKELEETVQNADPAAPGRSYELLYELNKRLRHELAAESERSSQLLRQISALQETIDQLERSGKLEQNAESVSALLKAMAQKNPHLAETLKKGGFDGSKLTADEMKRLAASLGIDAEKLKTTLSDLSRCLEKSSGANPAELQAAKEELANFIKENVPGCDDMIEALTNRENNGSPGECGNSGTGPEQENAGTPARGRGDAVLEYSGYTPEYGARRVDKKLVPNTPETSKDSSVLGRFVSDTEQKEERYKVKGGRLQNSSNYAGSREANLHPAHRKAVRRYFEREKKQ